MNKRLIKFKEFKILLRSILQDIEDDIEGLISDPWKPDYVVGITRGGLMPAVMASHYLNIPMHTLKVSLRDSSDRESNLWMAEDAFNGKNILVVDDINDSGDTLNWIVQDWEQSCYPKDERWNNVWNKNVRFMTVFNNRASKFTKEVDYYGEKLDKSKKDVWIEFPYENWWDKGAV